MAQLRWKAPQHTDQGMLTPDQLRAARALVKWSREDLADKSEVAAVTIKGFELLGADSKISTLNKLKRALEDAGVEFIDDGAHSYEGGPGVRLRGQQREKRR
jgi:ribosome-binding protein aMBF1 (putative translation factor)